jgi:hypothetical protein
VNLKWKLGVFFLPLALAPFWPASAKRNGVARDPGPDYKNNNCVSCHSRLLEPLRAGNRYLEWQFSRHREKGASCEKCPGGDPSAKDKHIAHAGMWPASDRRSKLHWRHQPETCGACHQNVTGAFAESAHYKQPNGIGMGPSCTTCHAHMATRVIYSPVDTAKLCSRCHDSINSLKPSSEIPARAKETMMALQRADYVIRWARLLLDNGRRWNLSLNEETNEFQAAEDMLREARVKWHTFDLNTIRKQADGAFLKGTKVKDGMLKKLGAD